MAAAARLGRRHLGLTAENPSVGALIVRFDEGGPVIIGRGVTAEGGRPHAEVQALLEAGSSAFGATAYVTLEPCSHYGKTPPCSKALIAAGIKRVVIGFIDPDTRVGGQGVLMLQKAGIDVELQAPNDDVLAGLSGYFKRKTAGRPEVTVKMAVSKDGAIGLEGRGFIPISSELSRARTHILRAEADAILVGVGTVLADDPMLDCRLPGLSARSPLRIVVDTVLKTPLTSKIVKTAYKTPLWIFCGKNTDHARKDALEALGVTVIEAETVKGQVDLAFLLQFLASKGLSNLLVEGGGKIVESFYQQAFCDRLIIFQAQTVVGVGGVLAPKLNDLTQLYHKIETNHYEGDVCTLWQRI